MNALGRTTRVDHPPGPTQTVENGQVRPDPADGKLSPVDRRVARWPF
jgi:hypothetical protein